MMTERVPPRLAVLTSGGNSAIQIAARELAWQGTRVLLFVADKNEAATFRQANPEPGLPVTIFEVPTELTADAMRDVLQPYGAVDVLIHGPTRRINEKGPVSGTVSTSAEVQRVIDAWSANVDLVVRHAAADWRSRVVTVVSSIARYRSGYFLPKMRHGSHSMDAACQSALLGLTRQRAAELAPAIALNAVATGWIGSPEVSPTGEVFTEAEHGFLLEEIALRRPGTPAEVAAVILFLASEASSYLTGEVIDVNGGWWMS
jgi:NAD(P)-dependent dehydrogenase (short-subunit alcohol dehydrogenase family)